MNEKEFLKLYEELKNKDEEEFEITFDYDIEDIKNNELYLD